MRKHIILFFSALLFLFACKWDNTPKGILQPDKMVNLLTAVHIVDGSIYNIDPRPDSLYIKGKGRYLAVFKRFHTDSVQFDRSLKYYTFHPDQMETMYEKVVKNLQDKSDSINKIKPTPTPKNALPAK